MTQMTANSSYSQADDNRSFLYQLQDVVRAIDQAGERILQDNGGIGFSQFKILTVLYKTPYSSQKHIASCLNLSPPAISRQVELMVSSGLLNKQLNPKNRREHSLSLTVNGESILDKTWAVLDSRFGQVTSVLSETQQQQLTVMLAKLSAELSK